MEKGKLEKRMYFLTLYNISEIQRGIQSGHAQNEYSLKYWKDKEFQDWAKNWKTWIILNGGVSRSERYEQARNLSGLLEFTEGTMEQHLKSLQEAGIDCAPFYEPDLNFSLSAIAFLVDERVFNREDYPDFVGYCKDKLDNMEFVKTFKNGPLMLEDCSDKVKGLYKDWTKFIGGEKIVFLKNFTSQFRLA